MKWLQWKTADAVRDNRVTEVAVLLDGYKKQQTHCATKTHDPPRTVGVV